MGDVATPEQLGAVHYVSYNTSDVEDAGPSELLIINPDHQSDVGAILIRQGIRRLNVDMIARSDSKRLEQDIKEELTHAKGFQNEFSEDMRLKEHGVGLNDSTGYPFTGTRLINVFEYNKTQDSEGSLPLSSMVSQHIGVLHMALSFINNSPIVSDDAQVRAAIIEQIDEHYPHEKLDAIFKPSHQLDASQISDGKNALAAPPKTQIT